MTSIRALWERLCDAGRAEGPDGPAATLDVSLERDARRIEAGLRAYRAPRARRDALAGAARISMLGREVLLRLELLARSAQGAVLEIGPYVGGSTSTIALGLRGSGRRFLTIEAGGKHLAHPTLPSSDILADLRQNVRRLGVEEGVEIVEGWAHDLGPRRAVARSLDEGSVGLFVVDADGDVAFAFAAYGRYLRDDCVVVLDDYRAPGAPEKEKRLRPLVDGQVGQGALRPFGVYGGTWFGQVNGPDGRRSLRGLVSHDGGACYRYSFVSTHAPDANEHPSRSTVELFEDDRSLGPPHSRHEEIRRSGGGRYSHWFVAEEAGPPGLFLSSLYFSASDGSNPNENGRRYRLRMGGELRDLSAL